MEHFITQQDADFFFEMEKYAEEEKEYPFPISGQKVTIPFTSSDKRENFLFDIYRGAILITKITYQNRVRNFNISNKPYYLSNKIESLNFINLITLLK